MKESTHILIILENDKDVYEPTMTTSQYIIHKTAEKANRLGREKKKIIKTTYENHRDNDEVGYKVTFYCEDVL
mgnify:CR=1 FL=1